MPDEDDILLDLMFEASVTAQAGETYEQVDATHATDLLEYQSGSTTLRRLAKTKPDTKNPPSMVTVRDGRTVDLPNKEFARVDIAISAYTVRSEREAVYASLAELVAAMLDREVAAISGSKGSTDMALIQPGPLPAVGAVTLGLTYGLTVNLGNYNFRKPTVGITETFAPTDFHAAWAGMVDWLMPRMVAQVKKARGKTVAKDIGL
jgi:hypothetical protein